MTRGGTVMVAVLVVIALAALATVAVLFRAQTEITAAVSASRRQQAYATALSGLHRAVTVLQAAGSDRSIWYDNPDLFRGQLVSDDGVNRWYFTIYAHNPADDENVRHGPIDEAGKVNLNFADGEVLLGLPNMTTELVDALMDYRDPDSNTRAEGAEQDYYDQLPYPYLIKNGLLGTVEELLLVKGFDARIVYGEDHNLNGLLEDNEDDGEESFPPDNGDGLLDRGLLGLTTVWTYEMDVDSTGQPRANVNDVNALRRAGLSQQTVQFVQMYLADGNRLTHPSQLLEMRYQLQRNQGRQRAGQWIESGVGAQELPLVMDKLTANPGGGRIPLLGKINVNTAPVQVLTALASSDEDLAARIASARTDLPPELLTTPAWLYTENVVDADTFKEIAPRLTARSYQFRIRCLAYGWPCGQFRVIEAVVDLARGDWRIVYQRDLTRLGVPFAIDVEQEEITR